MFKTFALASAGAAALLTGVPAFAQTATTVTVATDLNLRVGPGPAYEIVDTIPADTSIEISGCLTDQDWCQVNYEDQTGWVYGAYLIAGEEPVIVEGTRTIEVGEVTYTPETTDSEAALALGATGAAAGFLIAGPVGAAAGAAAGLLAGPVTNPGEEVITYVNANPVEPVFLGGEVVVGAGIPEGVVLHDVPDAEYQYAMINNQVVLVDPETRGIVYVMR